MVETAINQRSLMFLLTSMALISLPHLQNLPFAISGFFAAMLIWRTLGLWRSEWLPTRLLLLMLTLLGIALLISQHRGIFGRDAGTAIIMVASALKLFEIRGRRDLYLLVFLAFIIAATQLLYQQSIMMAGYIVMVGILLLATMLVHTAAQMPSRAAVKTAGVIVLQALPLAVVVFVLFPRIESPRWRWLEPDNQAKSGLSKTLEPGAISQMSLSDELVFRVQFDGEVPPPEQRYWRGPVYSHTDGVRWTVSSKAYAVNAAPVFFGKSYRYTVLMEPQQERWVFGLEMARDFDSTVLRSSLYELLTRKNPGQRAEYRLVSSPNFRTPALGVDELSDNLQLPSQPSAKLTELVRQLQGFDASHEVFIGNVLHYFRSENFFYTLTPPLLPDNPVEGFLFDTRSGFCSHYATAFVYLLRIAKIPARVVGGYQGGQYNRLGGFWEIRQADAHAWAEAWLGEKGWVRFDPTAAIAPERVLRGVNIELQLASGEVSFEPLIATSASWLREAKQLWQSVDYNWQRWVINYTPQNQLQLLKRFGIDGIAAIAQWLVLTVGSMTLLLAAWLFRSQAGQVDMAVRLYRQFCRKLARAGIAIQTGEGPTAFADRAKVRRPDLAAQIDAINSLFIRLRYEPQAHADDLRQLRKQVAKLKV